MALSKARMQTVRPTLRVIIVPNTGLISLAQVARSLVDQGQVGPGQLTPTVLARDAARGFQPAPGLRVVLRTVRIGRKLFTSAEWVEQFLAEVSDVGRPAPWGK